MIRLAITGGIGSGKSVIARLLMDVMDIPVYYTDNEAKRLNVESPLIRQGLTDLIGKHVYKDDGNLNKKVLADCIFSDTTLLTKVNAIIHPEVKRDYLAWVERNTCEPIVAMECAILYETGFETLVDEVAIVSAPLDIRIRRAMSRDHVSEEIIRNRVLQQLTDEELFSRQAHVIINDDVRPLMPQIVSLIENLQEKYCQ